MFNVYAMNEFEREIAIAEKVYDIAMSEVAYMEAMIDSKLKINMAKSELKVMQESSEESCVGDLAYLFNEAAKEAAEQGQSTFAKIKQAVVNFFTNIINAIQKVFTGKDTEAYKKMKASQEKIQTEGNLGKISAMLGEISGVVGNVEDQSSTESGFTKVLKIAGGAGLGLAGIAGIITAVKKLREEKTDTTVAKATADMESISNSTSKIKNAISAISESAGSFGQTVMKGLQSVANVAMDVFNKAKKLIDSKIGGKGGEQGVVPNNGGEQAPPAQAPTQNTLVAEQTPQSKKKKRGNRGNGMKQYYRNKGMGPGQMSQAMKNSGLLGDK